MGCCESTGDGLRRTLPLPKGLSALFMFYFSLSSLSSSFNPSPPPTLLPALLIPPIRIVRLGLKLWYNIY